MEREDHVGGFAHTEVIDGKAFDIACMYVAGGSIAGAGVEPTLQEMIDVSGATLSPAIDHFSLDTSDQRLNVIPEILQGYEHSDIIDQVLTGLRYTTQLFQCLTDPATCEECGDLCNDADMPIIEWGAKWGVPAYADMNLQVVDGLAVNPAVAAATFETTMSFFTTSYAGELLKLMGVTEEQLPDDTPPNIKSLIFDQDGWYFFDDGYQTFFEQLISNAGLQVETSFEVASMTKKMDDDVPSTDVMESRDSGGVVQDSTSSWHVTSSDGTELVFDQIIVTTAPQDAIPFVPQDRSVLLQAGVPIVPPNDLFLTRGVDINPADTDTDNGLVSFWPTGVGLGTSSIVDPTTGLIKSFFFQQRHNVDVWGAATVTLSPDITVEDAYMAVVGFARHVLGLEFDDDYLAHERFTWPSGPIDRDTWDENWATLQGVDGLWFSGEAFTQTSVPRISQYSKVFIDNQFPDVTEDNEEPSGAPAVRVGRTNGRQFVFLLSTSAMFFLRHVCM